MAALARGEQHLCQAIPETNCGAFFCATRNKFELHNIEVPVGVAVDPCTLSVLIWVGEQETVISYKSKDIQP